MMRAAPLALSGLLGLIVLEILKVIAVPVSLWLLGLFVIMMKVLMGAVFLGFAFWAVRSAVRASKDQP